GSFACLHFGEKSMLWVSAVGIAGDVCTAHAGLEDTEVGLVHVAVAVGIGRDERRAAAFVHTRPGDRVRAVVTGIAHTIAVLILLAHVADPRAIVSFVRRLVVVVVVIAD